MIRRLILAVLTIAAALCLTAVSPALAACPPSFLPSTVASDANCIFRDYNTDGVSSTGPFNPIKSQIRTLFGEVAAAISSNVAVVNNVATLNAGTYSTDQAIILLGYYTPGDGGGATLWNSGTATADGCTGYNDATGVLWLRFDSRQVVHTRACGAKEDGDDETFSVSATVGSYTVSMSAYVSGGYVGPSPAFTSADIGKTIRLDKAGTGGAGLITTISGVSSSSTITIAAPIVTAVSGPIGVFWGHDDTSALTTWWNVVQASKTGAHAHIDSGWSLFSSGLTWNYQTRKLSEVYVEGDGMEVSVLQGTQNAGVCLFMTPGTGESGGYNAFYNKWADFQVACETTGFTVQTGATTGGFQSNYFQNVSFIDYCNSGASAAPWYVVGVLTGSADNMQLGGCPSTNTALGGSVTAVGNGYALYATGLALMTFNGLTLNGGIHVTGNTGAPWPTYANVFNSIDVENAGYYAWVQDSNQSYANIINGGVMYTASTTGYLISVSAAGKTYPGASLKLNDVTTNYNPLYSACCTGATMSPALDPSNQIGVEFVGGGYGTVPTPAFPASGTPFVNNKGVTISATWGSATFTGISVTPSGGSPFGLPLNATSVALLPGDSITFTYSTGSPSWYLRNIGR